MPPHTFVISPMFLSIVSVIKMIPDVHSWKSEGFSICYIKMISILECNDLLTSMSLSVYMQDGGFITFYLLLNCGAWKINLFMKA